MHLRSTPLKKYQCSTESVERIRAFVMNGDGNPIVKARCAAVAVFVLLRERDIRDWAFVPSLLRTSRILLILFPQHQWFVAKWGKGVAGINGVPAHSQTMTA